MPESLQQKIDRMTAGMEVTVTFGGDQPGICTGPLIQPYGGRTLTMVGRYVRFADGGFNHRITAIDMPDPEPPFEMRARVRATQGASEGAVGTVTGHMVWCEVSHAGRWEIEVDGFPEGVYLAEALTLIPTDQPPFQPGDKVRWNAETRAEYGCDQKGQIVDFCERRRGQWRVNYVGGWGWDWADDLELVPAEPDCPAILVTYTDGGTLVFQSTRGGFGWSPLDYWLTYPDIATVQALRPAEYLRGGR